VDAEKRKKVVVLARKARKTAENIAEREDLPYRMNGMCARASAILFELLRAADIKALICFGRHHCYLKVDELVVDITATQFGYSRVFIVPENELYSQLSEVHQLQLLDGTSYWNYEDDRVFNNITDAMYFQRQLDWPEKQMIHRSDLR